MYGSAFLVSHHRFGRSVTDAHRRHHPYLLKQIDLRDKRIDAMTEANAKTNTLNEKIVGLYVEDQQERRRVGL
jgi:hypothetical protein